MQNSQMPWLQLLKDDMSHKLTNHSKHPLSVGSCNYDNDWLYYYNSEAAHFTKVTANVWEIKNSVTDMQNHKV